MYYTADDQLIQTKIMKIGNIQVLLFDFTGNCVDITIQEMNPGNYSPYNKSFRFICFQNQAYHEKNKRVASPCVKTNVRYSQGKNISNPQQPMSERLTHSSQGFRESRGSSFTQLGKNFSMNNSMIRSSSSNNAFVNTDKRVVHKNLSYEKFRTRKVSRQNSEMVNRLLQASCQVTQKKQTERSFQNHLKYKDVRRKFHNDGIRKSKMALGNTSLLCPTLSEYNKSGLGQKFVELDLSMSMSPSSPTRSYRKKRSDGPVINPKMSQSFQNQV